MHQDFAPISWAGETFYVSPVKNNSIPRHYWIFFCVFHAYLDAPLQHFQMRTEIHQKTKIIKMNLFSNFQTG